MKKVSFFLLITMLLFAFGAHAAEPEWVYSPNQGGIGIYNGLGGEVTVPGMLEDKTVLTLGDGVFLNNTALTGLTLPESVRSIGSSCLNGCANLERVTLPEGLQSIEYNNFMALPKLTELTIPASVTVMDYSVNWCENLRSVTFLGACPVFTNPDFCFSVLPEDLVILVPDDQLEAYRAAITNVKPEQIQPSGKQAVVYDYAPAPGELSFDAASGTVTGYTGDSLRVDIPAQMDGADVKAIGQYAFENSRVVYVAIPEGVAEIESMAFAGCADLSVIRMPDSLKKIGSYAFERVQGYDIAWGSGLEEIGDNAFQYVKFGAELTLPDSLRAIGEEAFRRASLRDVHIGSGIRSIGARAFEGTNLNYLELDAYDMIEVGENAFAGTRLEDIDLPWDCARENQQAWQALADSQAPGCKVWINNPPDCECPAAGTASFEAYPDGTLYLSAYTGSQENLVMWHTMDGVQITGLGDGVFRGNKTIKKYRVTHSDQFTAIGAEAFADSSLETVDLYYTTETIGAGAFRDCVNLTEITLPASLKSVGAGAFSGCINLQNVTVLCDPAILPEDAFEGTGYAAASAAETPVAEMPFAASPESDFEFDAETGAITAYYGTAVDVVIPRAIGGVPVKIIDYNAFDCARDYTDTEIITNQKDWLHLRSLVIPETVETIEDSAFSYCQQLELFVCYAPLHSTGRGTFETCRSLKNAVFVNGVEEIDNYCFSHCESLESVYWGDHLKRIGVSAFVSAGIRQLVIDAKTVDEQAFWASKLERTVLTDRVQQVHNGAFYQCADLTYLAVQFSEVERFGEGAPTAGLPGTGVTTVFPADTTEEQLKALNRKLNIWNGGHLGNGNEITLADVSAEIPALPDTAALIEEISARPVPVAATPEPAPLPDPIADIHSALGVWQLRAMGDGENELDVAMLGVSMTLQLNADGTAALTMEEEASALTWHQDAGVLYIGQKGDFQPAGLDEKGRLYLADDTMTLLFERAEEALPAQETAAPETQTTAVPAVAEAYAGGNAFETEKKYLAVTCEYGGVSMDASLLGGEYSVTLHTDGSCDLLAGGVRMAGTTWKNVDETTVQLDYMGNLYVGVLEDGRMRLDYYGMQLIFEVQ